MMSGVETRLDGSTLIVRIPMQFRRRGGRKRIVAPDGNAIVPSSKPQPDGTLVKALARAWRWQRMIDEGSFATVAEIAEAEGINASYVSRILRLTLLAPDLVEGIMDGQNLPGLAELLRPLPAEWVKQRSDLLSARAAPKAKWPRRSFCLFTGPKQSSGELHKAGDCRWSRR